MTKRSLILIIFVIAVCAISYVIYSLSQNTKYNEYYYSLGTTNPEYLYAYDTVRGSLSQIARTQNAFHYFQNNDYVFTLTTKRNTDKDKIIENYYKSVEEDYKKLYGDNYNFDRNSVPAPDINSPCSESVLNIQKLSKSNNSVVDITPSINLMPANISIAPILTKDNLIIMAGISCIGFDRVINVDYNLILFSIDTKTNEFNLLQNVSLDVASVKSFERGGKIIIHYSTQDRITYESIYNETLARIESPIQLDTYLENRVDEPIKLTLDSKDVYKIPTIPNR